MAKINGKWLADGTVKTQSLESGAASPGTLQYYGTDGVDAKGFHALGSLAIKNSVDISDDTNLTVSSPITLTGDELGLNQAAVDHNSLNNLTVGNPHTQYPQKAAVETVSGIWTVSNGMSFTVLPQSAATPSNANDLVNKSYVDGITQGIGDWQESVLDRYDPTAALPTNNDGDRYLSTATANGWTANNIYQGNGTTWDETVASEGMAVWVEDEDKLYAYNGSAWVIFGSVLSHGSLQDLGADDHTQYLLASGARTLTGNLRIGSNWISSDGGSEGIAVDANGNVGINTTGFNAQFQVAGTVRLEAITSGFVVADADGDLSSQATIDISTDTNLAVAAPITLTGDEIGLNTAGVDHNSLNNVATGDVHTQYLLTDGTRSLTGNLRLNGNWLSNDGGNEGVFVATDGKVGVGVDTGLTALMTVAGVIESTTGGVKYPDGNTQTVAADAAAATLDDNGTSFPGTPANGARFWRTDEGSEYRYDGTSWIAISGGGATAGKIELGDTSVEVFDTGTDGRIIFTADGAEVGRFHQNSYFGVGGVVSPEQMLHVNGNVQLGAVDGTRYLYFDNGTANNAGFRYESTTNKMQFSHDGTAWNDIDAAGSETDPVVGAITGIVKADGGGNIAAAVEDTDYQGVLAEGAFADGDKTKLDGLGAETDPIVGAINGLVKSDGAGNIAAAVEDTDYQGVPAEGAFADGDKTKLDSIDAAAATLDDDGAVFPGTPVDGARFWRTDEGAEYRYDGASWVAISGGAATAGKLQVDDTSVEITDTGTDGQIVFTTDGGAAAKIDNSQNFGIGITTMEEKLHVGGNVQLGASDGTRYIYFDNGTVNNSGFRYDHTTDKMQVSHDGTTWEDIAAGTISSDKIEEGNTSVEVIDTGADGRAIITTEGTERMRVESDGKVSVGNITAEELLTVDGNIQLGVADGDKSILFDNGTGNNSGVRYDSTSDKMQFSHDGSTWADMGSESVPAASLDDQGTSFPGSPVQGQRFFRTDEGVDYRYDGSAWIAMSS